LPFDLRWLGTPAAQDIEGGRLKIASGPRTDWFVDPAGTEPIVNAPALLGSPEGDFVLSARAEVDFKQTYDAGVLALWQDGTTWAKLCFEYSPQGHPMVVSVVTRGVSDDCNSIVVAGTSVWLRIAHIGRAYAFHASIDGAFWQFVRYFALGEGAALSVGFEVQSPLGKGCTARFTDVRFSLTTLAELRDGS
jgi:regulation of enolase protein 1 (concanavalin A-like superfamily)